MFIDAISAYRSLDGRITLIHPDFGYWLEGDCPARYATGPEDSVWIVLDEDDQPFEWEGLEWGDWECEPEPELHLS